MNKKTGTYPGFLMFVSKIKRYKNNNIVKKEQIRLKKRLNRLIYLKNTTNFVVCVIFTKAFRVGFKRFFTSHC